MPIAAKLLPDTVQFFPELRRCAPSISLNGEIAYQADPVSLCNTRRALRCTPQLVLITEPHRGQNSGGECTFVPCDREHAIKWFEAGVQQLPPSLDHLRQEQLRTIELLASLECWILRPAGPPDHVANKVKEFCRGPRPDGLGSESPAEMDARVPDMLRRFTATPLRCQLLLDGSRLALETNSQLLFNKLTDLHSIKTQSPSVFWRVVVEENGLGRAGGSVVHGIGEDTEPWVLFGDGSFLAFDAKHGLGIGFLSNALLQEDGFVSTLFLPQLARLQRSAIRVTASRSRTDVETYATGSAR